MDDCFYGGFHTKASCFDMDDSADGGFQQEGLLFVRTEQMYVSIACLKQQNNVRIQCLVVAYRVSSSSYCSFSRYNLQCSFRGSELQYNLLSGSHRE